MRKKNTHRVEVVELPVPIVGTSVQLRFHHYGEAGQGPKVYLQAALHADEIPGLLVMQKLMDLLDAADEQGDIVGHIVAAPVANPIGMNQFVLGSLQGRFYAENGRNFNRGFAELSSAIAERIEHELSDDATQNTTAIRKAAREVMASQKPQTALDILQHELLSRSIDADYVFDLHCDYDANLYFYTLPELWPALSDLAAYMGCGSVLLAEAEPSMPFDEANSGLWQRLSNFFPDRPIELACVSTTLELRSRTDVAEETALADAQGIYAYLQSRGVIAGDAPKVPALQCEATPNSGVGQIVAPHAGVVTYQCKVGEHVEEGEQVATLRSLDREEDATLLHAPVSGVLHSRQPERYTFAGRTICEIAGKYPLSVNKGKLMLSD
ncbi:MAG: succinylglutamate desuccinylase/aspartoacylase family protein [Pseudomonadota bacterium]